MQRRTEGVRLCFPRFMKHYLRWAILLFLLGCVGLPIMGDKPLKIIKSALKNNKPADAFRLVEQHQNDSSLTRREQLFAYAVEAARRLNDVENEKMYLKRKPDTTAFFVTLYNIFDYALRTEEAAMQEGRSRHRYRKEHAQLLNRSFANLDVAAHYFMAKDRMEEAARFSAMYLRAVQSPVFTEIPPQVDSTRRAEIAVIALLANYRLGHFEATELYRTWAEKSVGHRLQVLETLALSRLAQNDSVGAKCFLQRGITEFPHERFFFNHLAEWYLRAAQPDSLLALTAQLLPNDTAPALLYEAEAKAYEQKQEDSLCIAAAQRLLRADSTHIRADYYIGRSYFRLAQQVVLPLSINDPCYGKAFERRQHYYRKARPYLEFFRKNAPEERALWQPMLYEVYLKLNLGKEFEEISRM